MAISEDLRGVNVTITVRGNDLKEYRDAELEEDPRTTTRYIEAVSGQDFAVSIVAKDTVIFRDDALCFDVSVDGQLMSGHLILKNSLQYTVISEGRTGPDGQLRKYRFASLEIGRSRIKVSSRIHR